MITIIILFYWGLVVHITDTIKDTRAQKMVGNAVVRITESVFPHDQHWEEQNTVITSTASSFTRAQKVVSHTVAHYRFGVCTCLSSRGAKHFNMTSLCVLGLYTLHTHFLLHKSNTYETRTPKPCISSFCSWVSRHHRGALNNWGIMQICKKHQTFEQIHLKSLMKMCNV